MNYILASKSACVYAPHQHHTRCRQFRRILVLGYRVHIKKTELPSTQVGAKHNIGKREGDGSMSIKRIFRLRIDSDFRKEFDELFYSEALRIIHEAAGFISASIHKPTKWNPDEYAMVSHWENEASLKEFYGEE